LARGETKNPDFTARAMKIMYEVIIKKMLTEQHPRSILHLNTLIVKII
jgi:hypothetical protein